MKAAVTAAVRTLNRISRTLAKEGLALASPQSSAIAEFSWRLGNAAVVPFDEILILQPDYRSF